ncbi:DOG1 domain-containing protein [Heracleum sosnowskyi]|uniref:DOG1 domain-containing protein n=1 Tax=Heracleum sosnowskyi TaxID=360622 RepID=A0AAD8I4K4_9APIA|nr:DOG1 domain-containing protein [Heracleum sosnowskyi]
MATSSSSSNPKNGAGFESFFEGWLVRQEHYLDELQSVFEKHEESKDDEYLKDLSARIFSHYQEYYEEKSRMSNHNVFLVFYPPWFTPFERSFFWIAGFKPDLAFKVAAVAASDMTAEQKQMIEHLKIEIRVMVKELNNELARVQESVAAQELMIVGGRAPVGDEMGEINSVLDELQVELVTVLSNADLLRTRTVERVAAILNPVQNVKFLAAATQMQLRVRTTGLQREARNKVRN